MRRKDLQAYISKLRMEDQWVGVISPKKVLITAKALKEELGFNCLLDLCVVDYLTYGVGEWDTNGSEHGFSRARAEVELGDKRSRFVVVCHLLAMESNTRLRLKIQLGKGMSMPSLTSIWPSSDWYEREAYDLFGVIFENHPDFRRILTDYGFVGYPMRKDFPLIGEVEIRYDGEMEACVYEKVSIENRIGVPKVIRKDNRYSDHE